MLLSYRCCILKRDSRLYHERSNWRGNVLYNEKFEFLDASTKCDIKSTKILEFFGEIWKKLGGRFELYKKYRNLWLECMVGWTLKFFCVKGSFKENLRCFL